MRSRGSADAPVNVPVSARSPADAVGLADRAPWSVLTPRATSESASNWAGLIIPWLGMWHA